MYQKIIGSKIKSSIEATNFIVTGDSKYDGVNVGQKGAHGMETICSANHICFP